MTEMDRHFGYRAVTEVTTPKRVRERGRHGRFPKPAWERDLGTRLKVSGLVSPLQKGAVPAETAKRATDRYDADERKRRKRKMRKVLLLLASLSLLWVTQAEENEARAHGGSYRGPVGEVPPGNRDPRDPQPPPANDPPTTPGDPGGPTTPGPGGPTSPGDPAPPGPSPAPGPAPAAPPAPSLPGAGARTGGRPSGPPPMSFDNWLFWWAYNKDEILNIKGALKKMEQKVDTRTSTHIFGTGGAEGATTSPTAEAIRTQIIPALEKVVTNKAIHDDIRGGALIALSRCRDADYTETFFQIADPRSTENKLVKESAILALGIGAKKTDEVVEFLMKIADDKTYDARGRSFAMMCLGLLEANEKPVMDCILRRLDGTERNADVPLGALLSLGLLGDKTIVPEIEGWLKSGRMGKMKMDEIQRAWAISALGKIGDPAALKIVSDHLGYRNGLVAKAAMIAMGQLVPQASKDDQLNYVKRFVKAIDAEGDTGARNFGVIALGRIGGASGVSEDVRKGCQATIIKQFMDGGKVTERPFAALALGLLGFESDPKKEKKPQEYRYELATIIRREFQELKGDKPSLGAQAIALGMLGDNRDETVDLLIKVLGDRGQDKKLRGAAAMALGLIGAPRAKDAVMKALEEREDRDLRVDTAVAAGLLGDSNAVAKLCEVVTDAKASQFELGSVALALGQIGDARSIGPLVQILEPEKKDGAYPDLTRALVSVALGQIADSHEIRILSRISRDVNYRASFEALDEILTIL